MKRLKRLNLLVGLTVGLLAGVSLAAALYAGNANAETREATISVKGAATGRYAVSCVLTQNTYPACFVLDTTNGRVHQGRIETETWSGPRE